MSRADVSAGSPRSPGSRPRSARIVRPPRRPLQGSPLATWPRRYGQLALAASANWPPAPLSSGAETVSTVSALPFAPSSSPRWSGRWESWLGLARRSSSRTDRAAGIDELLNLLYVLLGLSVAIALLGMVNMQALSVMERTRELGTLRALPPAASFAAWCATRASWSRSSRSRRAAGGRRAGGTCHAGAVGLRRGPVTARRQPRGDHADRSPCRNRRRRLPAPAACNRTGVAAMRGQLANVVLAN